MRDNQKEMSVRTKGEGQLAGDRPARRRRRGDAPPEIRKSLNHSQVRDSRFVDGGGVGGAVSEMVNGPKWKRNFWNREQEV